MTAPAPTGPTDRWPRLAAAAVAGLLAVGAAWWLWSGGEPPPSSPEPAPAQADDPRLTFATPFLNVRPDVKYVGDAACAGCHQEHADTYRHHPMGQALAPVADATPIERYDGAALNPFSVGPLEYRILRRNDAVVHAERALGPDGKVLTEAQAEVQFAIGSGARARSYALNKDGYLFQSPVTWFPHAGRWDLSPGYEHVNRHFGRLITPGCLFCHANYADHVPGTINRYRPPIFHGLVIGCERCHGPGELHVKRRTAGEVFERPDHTIVNPARLEHSLREAVCQQCHVQGEQRVVCRGRTDFDYRPGLPLHLFLVDYVDRRAGHADVKFVNSVEQMMDSRCYRESREPKKLGCTSCHDPHKFPAPAEKAAHYRSRCLQCHTAQSCAIPEPTRREQVRDDSCVPCHMPQGESEVNHTSITDHRIPRRPPQAAPAGRRSTPGPADLVPFHRHLIGPDDPEQPRNLGLALIGMLDRGLPDDVARGFGAAALPLLDRAVARDRHDWPAVEARADALWLLGRKDEAMPAYEAAVAARPESEATLLGAGNLALELNQREAARGYFERAVLVNPHRALYYHRLAVTSYRLGEWERAVAECRQALRLEPTADDTRRLLILSYLMDGRRPQALAEYDTVRHLTPEARRAELAKWFDEEQRRARR